MNGVIDFRDASAVAELCERAATTLRESPWRHHCAVHLPANGRLLATGDLHDNPIHLQKIIRLSKLDQSPNHHVVLHEMIHSERLVNGIDLSHRMLVKVAQLVVDYPTQVHPLLANHELAQLTGRGVSKGAGNSVELFQAGLEFAFGDDAETVTDAIKEFISSMALAAIGGGESDRVFCAHSLTASHMMKHFDMQILDRDLRPEDYESPFGSAHLMVWGRAHTAPHIESLANKWKVKLFCIGHEHAETGFEIVHPRLVVLNSDHERGVALPIDLANIPNASEAMMSIIPLAVVPMP